MITLGLGLLTYELANSMTWLTGGTDGLRGVDTWPVLGAFRFDLWGYTAYGYALAVLFARLPPQPPHRQLLLRPGAARHPRERPPHAGHRLRPPRPPADDLHHLRRHGRRRRRAAHPDHRHRLARHPELPALGRRRRHADPRRHRPALRRHPRRAHLHARPRPARRHEPAILVLLDRPPAHGRRPRHAQGHPRRPRPPRRRHEPDPVSCKYASDDGPGPRPVACAPRP